jgi:transposase
MYLSKEERIEIILLIGNQSQREAAAKFNRLHPDREPITQTCLSRLVAQFKETGSIHDKPRSGPSRRSTDDDTATTVLAHCSRSPKKSLRRLSAETGVSKSRTHRILKAHKWHPYKIQLLWKLSEDDPDRRMEFCEWATQQYARNANFLSTILFSDEIFMEMVR